MSFQKPMSVPWAHHLEGWFEDRSNNRIIQYSVRMQTHLTSLTSKKNPVRKICKSYWVREFVNLRIFVERNWSSQHKLSINVYS